MDRKWSKCADTGRESVEEMEGIAERVTETRSQLAKVWRAAGQGISVGCVSLCSDIKICQHISANMKHFPSNFSATLHLTFIRLKMLMHRSVKAVIFY
jgi:hypothetical protein